MKNILRRIVLGGGGLALTGVLLAQDPQLTATTPSARPRFDPGRILVKPRSSDTDLASLHTARGCSVLRTFPRFGNLQVLAVPPGTDIEALVAQYQASEDIEYAEPDYWYSTADLSPNDPKYTDNTLWNLNNTTTSTADISAPQAWSYRIGAPEIIVAVIDTGIRYTHEDLALNMWVNSGEIPGNSNDDDGNGYMDDVYGIDAYQDTGNPTDCYGHGTHVAGIIGAVGNNCTGVVGVAWNVKLMALRAGTTSCDLTIDNSAAVECINYAIAKGADVINASWGGTFLSTSLRDAIQVAANSGIPFVTSAGNWTPGLNLDATANYPACFESENIVTVVATTKSDGLASYSNYGLLNTDLAAPGGDSSNQIYSTWRTTDSAYSNNYGTSMAAPHVAATLAMLKMQFPTESYLQHFNRLLGSVDKLGALTDKCSTGGRLNLLKALTSGSSAPPNDGFSAAFKLPGSVLSTVVTANNLDATKESNEPNHAGNSGGRSVWWNWTASSSGNVFVTTKNSTFPTLLAVYTGSSVGSLTQVGTADYNTDGCSWPRVNFSAVASTTYRIAVDGYNGAQGVIRIHMGSGSLTSKTLKFSANTISRTRATTQFQVQLSGPANASVTVEKNTSLTSASPTSSSWVTSATITLNGSGAGTFTDSSAAIGSAFYRASSSATPPVQSCNLVGYHDMTVPAGLSLKCNPFNAPDNRVSVLLSGAATDTTVYKWDGTLQGYYESTHSGGGSWSDATMTLTPGEGALIDSPSSQTFTFTGEVLQGAQSLPLSAGFTLAGSKVPLALPVVSGLNLPVATGNAVSVMVSGSNQTYGYYNGVWIKNGSATTEPSVAVGEAFWIHRPGSWHKIYNVWP